jgi:hypothetical protein
MNSLPFNPWIQWICPSPRRYAQELIIRNRYRTGLDIGCGETSMLSPLRGPGFHTTGLDVSEKMLESAKERSLHDEYILGDFRSVSMKRTFDVVVMRDVIEHFARKEGSEALKSLESIAAKMIYIETPNGFIEQPELDGNPFQKHLSGWCQHDFEERGYQVFGMGPRGLRGIAGAPRSLPEFVVRGLERGLQWYYFRRPWKAGHLAALRLLTAGASANNEGDSGR